MEHKRVTMKLLLIEDDAVDREMIYRCLTALQCHVEIAESGSDAVKKVLQDNTYDCVILDHMLPDVSSFELIPQIREANCHAPIVVVTSHGSETVAAEVMKAGAQDYIPKDQLQGSILLKVILHAVSVRKADLERQKVAEKYIQSLVEIQENISQRLKDWMTADAKQPS